MTPEDPPCPSCGWDKRNNCANWYVHYKDDDLDHTFRSRYQEVSPALLAIYHSFFQVPRDENGVHLPSEQEILLDRLGVERTEVGVREFVQDCWLAMLQEQHRIATERQKLQREHMEEKRKENARTPARYRPRRR